MKDWRYYKNKFHTQNEARMMDYELDLVHLILSNLYNGHDDNVKIIKSGLDEIDRKVRTKCDEKKSNVSAVSGSINDVLRKFDNGLELYQNNPVFANCVEQLIRGGDIYKIFEQIIVLQDYQQKHLQETISSGKIREELVVSKEKFDELNNRI